MHGRYLLDTNIIIALFASEQEILKHLEKAEEVFLSSIAMGELNIRHKIRCARVSNPQIRKY